MGLYDRDYGRDERTPWDRVENPRSMTVTLIVINVVVFFADLIFASKDLDGNTQSLVAEWFAVNDQTLLRPWMWWQFLTYGFVHDIRGITHVLFNMFGLYVFGREVERRMGQMEFLRFYLIAVVCGGIVGAITSLVDGWWRNDRCQRSSDRGRSSVCLLFPNREILLMFVFPVKAWVLAVFFVMMDLAGDDWPSYGHGWVFQHRIYSPSGGSLLCDRILLLGLEPALVGSWCHRRTAPANAPAFPADEAEIA